MEVLVLSLHNWGRLKGLIGNFKLEFSGKFGWFTSYCHGGLRCYISFAQCVRWTVFAANMPPSGLAVPIQSVPSSC